MNDPALHPHVERGLIGSVPVIRPVGDFDIDCLETLRDAFTEALADHPEVVVDLAGTTFVDSTVLGVIISAGKRATADGGWVRLVAPRPNVRRVLQITALDSVLAVYDDTAAAVGGPEAVPLV